MISPAAFLRTLKAALKAECGAKVGPFVREVARRASCRGGAQVACDADSARTLSRLGIIPPDAADAGAEAAFRDFIGQVARATGEDPIAVTVMLRLFSSGLYGIMAEPICGDVPACGRCPFAASCRFVAAMGKSSPPDGRKIAAALLTGGARELSEGELVAFLLNGRDAGPQSVAEAEAFLDKVGSMRSLAADALAGRRPDLSGLDEDRAARLACAVELLRRYAEGPRKSARAFRCAEDFYRHFHLRLRDRREEVFCVALLDQKLKLIDDPEISSGTLTTTLVHPREVFAPAIQRRAAAVALIHNHPSGDPAPSKDDRNITRRLADVAELTGIRLLDHVIIGDARFFSFAEKGLL